LSIEFSEILLTYLSWYNRLCEGS